MKLICSVTVCNRLLPTLAVKAKKKSTKATVALCKHPNSADKYYLILFSGQDKSGIRYDLVKNIEKVITKFICEGKTTIQFKNPPHDLFLHADVIPLKGFLHLLQRILRGTISPKELTCSSLAVTPVSTKDFTPKKLVIERRSEYPIKGFPRSLESLTITKINRLGLDLGILRLSKLKVLNLSENSISTLPIEFSGMLCLGALDLSKNKFYKSSKKDWKWLGGNLCKTLHSLNLSNNQLVFIPEIITKLQNLNSLNISENQLETLPQGIGRLSKLKELKLGNNLICEFPGSVRNLKLQVVDVSNNRFRDMSIDPPHVLFPAILPVYMLKEYAAQRVLDLKLLYNSEIIPETLVTFLDQQAKYCVCGKPCFRPSFHKNSAIRIDTFADVIITSNNYSIPYIPVSCYFCSLSCAKVYQRDRVPLIR